MTRPKGVLAGMKRPSWKLRRVNGFEIRMRYPDWDVVETNASVNDTLAPFVPIREAWIDRRFWRERKLLLSVHWYEQALGDLGWSNRKIRRYLKRHLVKNGPAPNFTVRTRQLKDLTIRYVLGDIVRAYLDPQFVFGGHDCVYKDYIPKDEVWIDIRQDHGEIKYTLFHELHERELMVAGMRYDIAHARATEEEKKLRAKDMRSPKPLKMRRFSQKSDYCGPAALRIVANYLGKKHSEDELAKLCGTVVPNGTEHAGLIEGARAIGATVFAKENGTLTELRRFIYKHGLPIIVGWWDGPNRTQEEVLADIMLDEGHFCAVYHITKRYIFMMDPQTKTGRRKGLIKNFLYKWWDLDTPEYVRSNHWYMVINFHGKKFKIADGANC